MQIEREIYNWKYSFDRQKFEIIPSKSILKPQFLHKLYGLNQYSLDSLINQYIYATHPSQLNDIFDCNEELLDFDDIEVIKIFLKDSLTESEIDRLQEENPNELKILVQRNFREKMYRKWGVFSMTGNPNNILMWSYYCNHNGFCIEFDISKFPFRYFGPFPINYQPKLETLSIKQIGVQIGILAQCNLKSDIWKHENEWRLMIAAPDGKDMVSPNFEILKSLGGHNRKFIYPLSAIRSIALGNRFFEPDEIEVIDSFELRITLKSNLEQKILVLDFLSSNQILTYIGLRTGFTEIKFRTSTLERIDFREYRIKAYEVV